MGITARIIIYPYSKIKYPIFYILLDGCDDKPVLNGARIMLENDRKTKEKPTRPSKIYDELGTN